MRCYTCGSENRDDARFCRRCGSLLEAGTPVHDNHDKDDLHPRRSSSKALLLILALMSLATVLAGAFLLLRDNIGNEDELSATRLDGTHVSDKLFYSIPASEHIVEDDDAAVTFVDNEVILYLAEGCTQKDAESIAEQYDGEIVGLSTYTNSYQLRFIKTRTYDELNRLIEELGSDSRIEEVSKNIALEVSCDVRTSDPVWSGASEQFWGLTAINAPEAWDIVQAGPDVHVGIIDTQFFTQHEDLAGAFSETMPSYETSFNAKGNGDSGKHGTHVAGIIGARANNVGIVGVAPGATMYGYSGISNMVNKSGKKMITLSYGLEVGWTYLIAENGCRVVNMSLGADELQLKNSINSASVVPEERQQLIEESNSCENSIRALVRAGYDDFVICKSAGNSGEEGGLADYDFLGYIAAEDVKSRIIMVGSVSGSDGRTSVSPFSCGGHRVDIVAPGEDIYSTYYDYTTSLFGKVTVQGTYSYLSGTSMAAPMVAGTAALVIAANPSLKGDQIKQVVCESAEQGGYAVANLYSVGLLDAEAAVRQAQAFRDSNSEASDSEGEDKGMSEGIEDTDNNESGQTESGSYILSGTVRVHEEDFGGQRMDKVVSIVLDEVVPYEYEYKGTVQAEAHEVLLATTGSEFFGANEYEEWARYDGQHITVECDGLQGAYHDASYWKVDTLATGTKRLLDRSGEQAAFHVEDYHQQIEHQAKAPVVSSTTSDFDGDGAEEAFVVTGTQASISSWTNAELWFVSSSGNVSKVAGEETFPAMMVDRDYVPRLGLWDDSEQPSRYYGFFCVEATSGGPTSVSHAYGVRDGEAVEASFDIEYIGDVHTNESFDKIVGYTTASISPRTWQKYGFDFDPETFTFRTTGPIGDPEDTKE